MLIKDEFELLKVKLFKKVFIFFKAVVREGKLVIPYLLVDSPGGCKESNKLGASSRCSTWMAGPSATGPFADFAKPLPGARSEVQSGQELAPTWDAGVVDSDFTCCITVPTPGTVIIVVFTCLQ